MPGNKASLQHADPVCAFQRWLIRIAGEREIVYVLFMLLRVAPQCPNITQLGRDHISCVPELHLTNIMEACLNLSLCFCERVARHQHVRVQMDKAVGFMDEISGPAGGV